MKKFSHPHELQSQKSTKYSPVKNLLHFQWNIYNALASEFQLAKPKKASPLSGIALLYQEFFSFYMAKKRTPSKVVRLQLKAGQANPAPPVGTALGPTGIQIAEFCKQFNDATKDRMGMVLPTVINIYEDRTFDFYTKQPPMTYLIKTELNLKSGSKLPHKDKVAHLTSAQLQKIAEIKMPDLNANDMEHAMSIVAGSARSMGITSDIKK